MLVATLAMAAYLTALLCILPTLAKLDANQKPNTKQVLGIGLLAVGLHFVSLYQLLFVGEGQNFTIGNVGSLISVMMSLIATFALTRWKTVWFPLSIIYPLGIVSVALSAFVEGSFIKQLAENSGFLFHLSMAIISYALFVIALLYAFQLKWLDHKLKSKKLAFSPVLPPLMTVERHFFHLTLVAQILLTATLISGMLYLHNFFAAEHIHKAVFSFMAWIVYSILLLGQWKLRWQGSRALVYSAAGMLLLTIAYFGSRII